MYPHPIPPRARDDRDELYNNNTISEDLSKGASVEQPSSAFEEYVVSPRPPLS